MVFDELYSAVRWAWIWNAYYAEKQNKEKKKNLIYSLIQIRENFIDNSK